jgi:hypothetical protein
MSKLLVSLPIGCPYNLARQYLEESIGPRAASGEASPLKLTVSAPALHLSQPVTVTYGAAVDPMHLEQPWHIHWTPESSLYPEFDGELTVRADWTYATARLELAGNYHPPGGLVGEAFDFAAGSRIARDTALLLLQRLGGDMEARYQRDEQAKARQREAIRG